MSHRVSRRISHIWGVHSNSESDRKLLWGLKQRKDMVWLKFLKGHSIHCIEKKLQVRGSNSGRLEAIKPN